MVGALEQERSLPLKIHTLIIQEIELLLLILKADLDPHLHLIPSSLSDPDPDLVAGGSKLPVSVPPTTHHRVSTIARAA